MVMLAGTTRWCRIAKAKASGDQLRLAELLSEFGESADLLFVDYVLPHLHNMHHMPAFWYQRMEVYVGPSCLAWSFCLDMLTELNGRPCPRCLPLLLVS